MIDNMTNEQKKYFKLSIEAYRQCAIDSAKIIADMFEATVKLYNQKLRDFEGY